MKPEPLILEGKHRTPSYRWQIGLAFFAFIVMGANDGAIGVLIPEIMSHYAVDKAIVSWLLLCSSGGYMTAAFNSGFLVNKLGQRRFLLLGGSALIVSALSISLMPPFAFLTLPFFLVGFGIATLDTGLNAYMTSLPRSTERLNYLHAFYGVGALLGPIIASAILVAGLTWNYAYSLWDICGLFFFFGVVFTFKKQATVPVSQSSNDSNPRGSSGQFSKRNIQLQSRITRVRLVPLEQTQRPHTAWDGSHKFSRQCSPRGTLLRSRLTRARLVPLEHTQQPHAARDEIQNKTPDIVNVLRLPITWIVASFLFSYVGVEISLGTWSYSFLTEQRQLPALLSAWMVSGYWIGLTLGRIVLAQLVTWLSERTAIQICVIGAMLGMLLTWLIPITFPPDSLRFGMYTFSWGRLWEPMSFLDPFEGTEIIGILSAFALCFTGFCLGPIFPTTMAIMPQLFPRRLLATAIGLVASLGGLGGSLIPWLSGYLAQTFGLWIIWPLAIALTAMMFLLWMLFQLQQTFAHS